MHNTSLSPSSALSSKREFGSCKLCGNDFSNDSWLKMYIISKYQTNSQAPNQCTIPLSLSSAMSSPREFGSCKLCGKDFSIDSWLKMHIISKYQSNSQDLALSFFLVLWSLFSILRHLQGVWIGDLWKETYIKLFLYHISCEKKNISLYL